MKNQTFRKLGVLALAGAATLAACEDDPMEPEEHGEPAAVRLMLNGAEIARAAGTNVGTSTGHIHVHPGEETAHITVEFLDEDEDVITFDSDFYLEVAVTDESIAEFEQDTPGEFGGHAHGVAEGETTMVFRLMHGAVGSGHSDFDSAPIEVEVEDHEEG